MGPVVSGPVRVGVGIGTGFVDDDVAVDVAVAALDPVADSLAELDVRDEEGASPHPTSVRTAATASAACRATKTIRRCSYVPSSNKIDSGRPVDNRRDSVGVALQHAKRDAV